MRSTAFRPARSISICVLCTHGAGWREPVRAGAVLGLGHVGHVGACGRNVATREAVNNSRDKEHRNRLRHREHDEADYRAKQAENQDRPAAVAIRQVAERRRRDQLADRKHTEQHPDHHRRRAEALRVERQQRNDDAKADEVDENREKDDQQRSRH